MLDEARNKLRLKHYSLRTEHAYISWIKRFILFHGKRRPQAMGLVKSARWMGKDNTINLRNL